MSSKVISEADLRHRLLGKLTPEEIETLLNEYENAEGEIRPNMEEITRLTQPQKKTIQEHLIVRFDLDSDRFDALVTHFNDPNLTATAVVKKALDEFIARI